MGYGSYPVDIKELYGRNISLECPTCHNTIMPMPIAGPVNHDAYSYFIGVCPNRTRLHCKPILAVYESTDDRIEATYPIPSFDASSFHEAIPMSIREDYAEGVRCIYVKSYKAAVTMYRRVVEALACDKLGSKAKKSDGETKKLRDLIDVLNAEGLITKDLTASAHELRLFGNYGAHVQDDGLDKVEPQEARDVREITWQLLYSIYIAPFKTAELREKRTEKGKP